jgi:dTDP-4-amino-4,6-dideoxygalactose transaminase
MGLCNLKYIDEILKARMVTCKTYDDKLATLKAQKITINKNTVWNHAYYPVVFESEKKVLKVIELLNGNWVYPRRYFYPTLSKLNYVKPQETPIADDIAKRVLCLPLYHGLKEEDIVFIARLLLRVQNN